MVNDIIVNPPAEKENKKGKLTHSAYICILKLILGN